MTPIWQAECPGLDEDSADDLWRAAFEPWPRGGEHQEAQPDLTKLLGLPKALTPQPRLPVGRRPKPIHYGSFPVIGAVTFTTTPLQAPMVISPSI
jgi:hypothetical protein